MTTYINVLKLDSELPTPRRAHPGDAGIDLYARRSVSLSPGQHTTVPTGIAVSIPDGHAGLVLPRSGLAARFGVGILNAPGLIDAGYRGEIKVVMVNHGRDHYSVSRGDRIAQLVILSVLQPEVVLVDALDDTERGAQGLGSSGL